MIWDIRAQLGFGSEESGFYKLSLGWAPKEVDISSLTQMDPTNYLNFWLVISTHENVSSDLVPAAKAVLNVS